VLVAVPPVFDVVNTMFPDATVFVKLRSVDVCDKLLKLFREPSLSVDVDGMVNVFAVCSVVFPFNNTPVEVILTPVPAVLLVVNVNTPFPVPNVEDPTTILSFALMIGLLDPGPPTPRLIIPVVDPDWELTPVNELSSLLEDTNPVWEKVRVLVAVPPVFDVVNTMFPDATVFVKLRLVDVCDMVLVFGVDPTTMLDVEGTTS
jgi:hypothetical protein